jgi:hypothetical protein
VKVCSTGGGKSAARQVNPNSKAPAILNID